MRQGRARPYLTHHRLAALCCSRADTSLTAPCDACLQATLIAPGPRILENRLEKENVNFNEAVAQNKMLRAEIDSLRKERLRFQGIYK